MRRVRESSSIPRRSNAMRRFSQSATTTGPPSESGGLPDVLFDLSVSQMNRAVRVRRNLGFVRHKNDGVAGLVQAGEERHDLVARLRIEEKHGFVVQQDVRA